MTNTKALREIHEELRTHAAILAAIECVSLAAPDTAVNKALSTVLYKLRLTAHKLQLLIRQPAIPPKEHP